MSDSLVDIGANLTHDSFDDDRSDVIERATAVGVHTFVVTGSSAAGSTRAYELAAEHPEQLYATAGVHPHHATEYDDDTDTLLRKLLEHPEVVAVGECGLDYFRNFSPRDAQRSAFEKQLQIAAEVQKPLFLHQRDAHEDFCELLGPAMSKLPRCVAHCFTGDERMLRAYLDLGMYIGITGWICDERRGTHLRELMPMIPLDRIMIETDAPYLLPRTLTPKPKSRRNEPMYLPEVLRVVADSAGVPVADMATATTANAKRFFALPQGRERPAEKG